MKTVSQLYDTGMGRRCEKFRWLLPAAVLLLCVLVMPGAHRVLADEATEQRAVRTNAAYLMRLKRMPRPGAALDRIYAFHVDRGTVDGFLAELSADAATDDASALIAGFVEQRRGQFDAAQTWFQQAHQGRPDDPIPLWHLGQVQLSLGEFSSAAGSLEEALKLATIRRDKAEIFELLGRTYQRSQRPDKALDLWRRYEAAFPGDIQIQKQIASALADDGQYQAALTRYQDLSESATDPYKKTEFSVKAAELHLKLGEPGKAIAAFERQLERLKPGSWQRDDIRNRIDQAVLTDGDTNSLATYYKSWLQRHPDDLDAMSRLAKTLAATRQHAESVTWYQRAIAKAPTNVKLREALIDEFAASKNFAEAAEQCEQLANLDTDNLRHLERMGRLVLQNEAISKNDRVERATEIWNRLRNRNPDDALHLNRVADLFRRAGLVEQTISLSQNAIQLAPDQPQLVEYLGEYFHSLNRRKEAVGTLRLMASGDRRTGANLARLSGVFRELGYTDQATAAMKEAVDLAPDVANLVEFATLLTQQNRIDDALQQLQHAENAAVSNEDRRRVRDERIEILAAAGRLRSTIERLTQQFTSASSAADDKNDWQYLGLLQEAAGDLRGAAKSLQRAVRQNPQSQESWNIAAGVMEKAGLLADAANAHRRIAAMDRRTQVEHLKRVAELEQQLGRSQAAMQAAEEVVEAAPGNPEGHRFFAEMCFRLGQPKKAVESLRQSVRTNPGDRDSLIALADVLAEDFQTEAALELYWRAFEKTEDLNARIAITRSLAKLYLRLDSFPQLVTRLRTLSVTSEHKTDLLKCLGNAYQLAGDLHSARTTYETLLQEFPNDVAVLREAVVLAESVDDGAAAIRLQRRVVEQTSSDEDTSKLAEMFIKTGDAAAAAQVWNKRATDDTDTPSVLLAVDNMIAAGMLDDAADLATQILTRQPQNWHAHLRLAVARWRQGQHERAVESCRRILAIAPPAERRGAFHGSGRSDPLANPLHWRNVGSQVAAAVLTTDADFKATHLQGVSQFDEARRIAYRLMFRHHTEGDTASKFLNDVFHQTRTATTEAGKAAAAWSCFYAVPELTPPYRQRLLTVLRPQKTANAQLVWLSLQLEQDLNQDSQTAAAEEIAAFEIIARHSPGWLRQYDLIPRLYEKLKAGGDDASAQDFAMRLQRPDASGVELEAAWALAVTNRNVNSVLKIAGRLSERSGVSATQSSSDGSLNSLGWKFAELASAEVAEGNAGAVERLLTGFLRLKAAMWARGQWNPNRNVEADSHQFVITASHRTFQNGRQTNSTRVSTLPPDERFSSSDINFFVNLEALADESSWTQLLSTVQEFRRTATDETAIAAELSLAQLNAIHGDQDASAIHLTRAAVLDPENAGMRLKLAQFHAKSGHAAEALALLDTVSAVDQGTMTTRETMALELAMSTGNTIRATQAAERLFGLRLETDAAIKLAGQLRTLERSELADALLNRIQRGPDNGVQTLESLMQQYHEQGNAQMAAQVAQQILQETNTGSRRSAAATAVREAAIRMLAQLGRLEPQIQRMTRRLQQEPRSVDLLRSLMEVYRAVGQSAEAVAMAERLADVQPDSIDHLLRLATQYEKVRNYDAAVDQYVEILKKDPQRFTRNYFQYLRTFTSARRLPDLADVLLTVDLRKLNNNYYVVGEAIEALFKAAATDRNDRTDRRNQEKGLELLAAAWKAFPNDRSYLLNNVRDPDIWNLPVMFDYAREGMIPATRQQAIARPWRGIAESPSFDARGRISGTLTRVLRAMPNERRLLEFATEVETASKTFPDWHGGRLIQIVLNARAGQQKAALQLLEDVSQADELRCVPTQAAWLVGAELEQIDRVYVSAATSMLQRSLDVEGIHAPDGYERSAGCRLAVLYSKRGKWGAARDVVLKTLTAADRVTYNEPGRKQWQQLADLHAAATSLAHGHQPVDAIGVCRRVTLDLLVASEQFKDEGKAHRRYRETRQLESQLKQTLTPDVLAKYLSRESRPSGVRGWSPVAVDLLLTPPPAGARLTIQASAVLEGLQRVAKRKSVLLTETLTQQMTSHTTDTSLAVAAYVYATAKNDVELRRAAIRSIQESGAVTRSSDVVLWFVARSLLRDPAFEELGSAIADRAEEAARLCDNDQWLQAILRERGDVANEAGDRVTAEEFWTELLDVVIPPAKQSGAGGNESAVRELREGLLRVGGA